MLFTNGVGRVDLPDSNPAEMKKSIVKIKKNLDGNLRVYPGHNYGGVDFVYLSEIYF